MTEDYLHKLRTQVTATEMAQLLAAIPQGGETDDLHWIAKRMAFEIDWRRAEAREAGRE